MSAETDDRAPRQLALPLAHAPAAGRADFYVSSSNRAAAAMVANSRAWVVPRLALAGPAASGKSHLARIWADETGAMVLEGRRLTEAVAEAGLEAAAVLVEGADRLDAAPDPAGAERALLHLHNLMAAERRPLLLTGRAGPARWPAALPDLASRLAALPVARIDAPDDALLSALIVKLLTDRQLHVRPDVLAMLARGIERSHAAVAELVEALDTTSLAERRSITRELAAATLKRLGHG